MSTVILDSQLQKNTGVTQELFMEGYKIAVERNEGIPPEDLLRCSFETMADHALGEDMQQPPRTLQQGCATMLLAALNRSLRGNLSCGVENGSS